MIDSGRCSSVVVEMAPSAGGWVGGVEAATATSVSDHDEGT